MLDFEPNITNAVAECAQWNAVALWAWDIVVDNCAICRNHIMDLCELVIQPSCFGLRLIEAPGIECQANQASAASEECTVAWGICNVRFYASAPVFGVLTGLIYSMLSIFTASPAG